MNVDYDPMEPSEDDVGYFELGMTRGVCVD